MTTLKNQMEYDNLSEVQEILEDLIIRLNYQVTTNVKKSTLTELEALQESIFNQRREYQQNKLLTLKTA